MKEMLEDLADKRLPLPGLLAWSACLPDGSTTGHGFSEGFGPERIQEFVSRLHKLALALAPENTRAVCLQWAFQLLRVYTVLLPRSSTFTLIFGSGERLPVEDIVKLIADVEKQAWVEAAAPARAELLPQ